MKMFTKARVRVNNGTGKTLFGALLLALLGAAACGGFSQASPSYSGESEAVSGGADYGGSGDDFSGAEYAGGESAGPSGGSYAVEAPAAPPSMEAAPSPGSTVTTNTTVTVDTVTHTTVTMDEPYEPAQQVQPQALLTAASVGDVDRRTPYLDYLARHPREAAQLQLDLTRRVRFRVVDSQGQPVNDASVELMGAQVTGRTHADGYWDFYPSVHGQQFSGAVDVQIRHGQGNSVQRLRVNVPNIGDGPEVVVQLPQTRARAPRVLDLGFAIDVTGSMEDELRYVNAEVGSIVARITQAAPETVVRVGAVLYRDRSDRQAIQQIQFTRDINGFANALRTIHASGGGDYPEDLNAGLDAALNRLSWSTGNSVRALVLIADAPPKAYHDARFTYRDAAINAGRRGIRILPVAASGSDETVEFLFRGLGALTSTPYVYLTDDSGIGNAHREADTDRVAVEYFSDLLARVVISDLRGRGMHEPGHFGPVQ